MHPVLQAILGIGLAAGCGLRAWLPLLATGLAGRIGWVDLHSSFAFLARTDVIVVLVIATVVELLADKIALFDHILDSVSFIIRPAAGAILASSVMFSFDPAIAVLLGLVFGGGAALSVHSAKSLIRAKSTTTSMFHGGVGNTILSVLEDLYLGFAGLLALLNPWLAFFLAVLLFIAAVTVLYLTIKTGQKIFRLLFGRKKSEVPASSTLS